MDTNTRKQKLIFSLLWKYMERSGVQIAQFIIQIILARLLLPDDYGVVGLITIFLAIANVFVESGFNTALMQKKEVDDLDFSSVLSLSLIVSVILYVILFLAAPFISRFYGIDILVSVIRVLSITLIIGSLNSIQIAKVNREFRFKSLFYCSLISVALSGTIGIILAYFGYGIWALVFQQLLQKLFITLFLFYSLRWKPSLEISMNRIKPLFSFGSNLLVSNLINTIYLNLYGLIIGKVYSPTMLGYYNRAEQFPNILVYNICISIQSVMLPAMAKVQDRKDEVKSMVRRTLQLSSFIIFPMMFGLAACSELVIRVVLTEQWLPAVPFMQLLCLYYATYQIQTANLQAINAIGRSDIYLKIEIVKKVVGVIAILLGLQFGIYMLVALQPILGVIFCLINAFPNRDLLNYSIKEQVSDLIKSLFTALLMFIIIIVISKLLILNPILELFLCIILGATTYIFFSFIFKSEALFYFINLLNWNRKK